MVLVFLEAEMLFAIIIHTVLDHAITLHVDNYENTSLVLQ